LRTVPPIDGLNGSYGSVRVKFATLARIICGIAHAVAGEVKAVCGVHERWSRMAERTEEHRWLITGLWSEQAVGIVGGEPTQVQQAVPRTRSRRGRRLGYAGAAPLRGAARRTRAPLHH
jgi:hypothetical protein